MNAGGNGVSRTRQARFKSRKERFERLNVGYGLVADHLRFKSRKERFEPTRLSISAGPSGVSNPGRNGLNLLEVVALASPEALFQIPEGTV